MGILNSFVSYALFSLLNQVFGLDYMSSIFFAFTAWSWFGYELQRLLVFTTAPEKFGFLKFLGNQAAFFLVAASATFVLVEFFFIQPQIAYLINLGLIGFGIYLSSLFFVFKKPKES